MKKVILFISMTGIFGAALADGPILPHLELVNKYLLSVDANGPKTASCKGSYMMPEDDKHECWAAHVAKDLSAMPIDTRDFVLNVVKRDAALSRCQGLSLQSRFDSRECAAVGQADTFVSLRLPRMKLEPVKFR